MKLYVILNKKENRLIIVTLKSFNNLDKTTITKLMDCEGGNSLQLCKLYCCGFMSAFNGFNKPINNLNEFL